MAKTKTKYYNIKNIPDKNTVYNFILQEREYGKRRCNLKWQKQKPSTTNSKTY